MKILITNLLLVHYSGTETYIHDLALSLKERGHTVGIYASFRKNRVQTLLNQGIEVVRSLNKLSFVPDIVHGHHHYETVKALSYFNKTPGIFICHSPISPMDRAPKMDRIVRYFGVDQWCRQRIAKELSVPIDQVGFLNNFVNTRRFQQRTTPLPKAPQKALVFSNYASASTFLPLIQAACRKRNIQVDAIGSLSTGVCTSPETLLEKYDLVFGKSKAAIEALATGNCVILCDHSGFGGMVTSENFHRCWENNFGWNVLFPPILEHKILEAIDDYDPLECQKTCALIRERSSLESFTDTILDLYSELIGEFAAKDAHPAQSAPKIRHTLIRKRLKWLLAARYPRLARVYKTFESLYKRAIRNIL